MKDSASAASAGAELVLRRFPWAVLVRRPLLPPSETLPDRWLQAAEEEEVELLPFRSPPREENGTGPTQAPAGERPWGVAGREGGGPDWQVCVRTRASWGDGAQNCLEASGLAPAGRECSSFEGEGQEAGSRSGTTARRGNPQSRDLAPTRAPRGGRGASQGVPARAERPQRARRSAQPPSSASPGSAFLLAPVAGR